MNSSILALPGALSGPGPLHALRSDLATGPESWITRDILADIEDGCSGFDDMAHRLVATTRNQDKPILLGYSLGARLALHALCTTPQHWAGAILISGHPGLQTPAEKSARREDDHLWAERVRTLPWDELLVEWEQRPVFAAGQPPETWRGDLRAAWRDDRNNIGSRRAEIAASLELWSLGVQENCRDTLATCPVPVLWLTGEEDVKFTALGRELAAIAPCVSHKVIPSCGHRLPWEAPAAVADAMAKWFQLIPV